MMFYLTLPSNSSMQYYPGNHPSHYLTKLPQPIELNVDYEVGLSEILFSNTYFNMGDTEGWFQFRLDGNSEQSSVLVPGGLYASVDQLIAAMNTLIRRAVGKKKQNDIKILHDRSTRKVHIKLYKRGGALKVSNKLKEILNLNHAFLVGRATTSSTGPIQFHKGNEGIYVYCDLVQPRPVGDVMVPLLRLVPTGDRTTEVVHHMFEKPNKIPLSRFQFNMVVIFLTSDTGHPLSF